MCQWCPNYDYFIKECKNAINKNDLPSLMDFLERLNGEYEDWEDAMDTIIDLLLYARQSNSAKEFLDAIINEYQSQSNLPRRLTTSIVLPPTKS